MTMFMENPLGSGGHTNRLIWLAPDPPQGLILYYNARINSTGNGEVLEPFVTEIYTTQLSIRPYTSLDGEYSVEVYNYSPYNIILVSINSMHHIMWHNILCACIY